MRFLDTVYENLCLSANGRGSDGFLTGEIRMTYSSRMPQLGEKEGALGVDGVDDGLPCGSVRGRLHSATAWEAIVLHVDGHALCE